VIVCFVDIGGIVDHHCLNFLFTTYYSRLNGHIHAIICIKTWTFLLQYHWKFINSDLDIPKIHLQHRGGACLMVVWNIVLL